MSTQVNAPIEELKNYITPEYIKEKLKEPFPPEDIEWRIQQCGKTKEGKIWAMVLAYVSARAIMNRLDETVGIFNWKNEYLHLPDGMMCRLSIYDGSNWISKEDGAEKTDIEAFKGGISSALKRAAVLWGIGRYLYNLDSGFAQIVQKGASKEARAAKTKEGDAFYWLPPALPTWALPKKENK